MKTRKLGCLEVSEIGLGCADFTTSGGVRDDKPLIETLHRAVDLGVTLFDTAESYGPYESETVLGKGLRGLRDRVVIATKFGFRLGATADGADRWLGLDGGPANVKRAADASLKRLGIDEIDLFYLHRVDPQTPIEDTVGAMAELVQAGKVRALGLCEATAPTIRRAQAVHPLAAVQCEYSLWRREPEAAVIPTCRELGVGVVAYSPLGHGVFTGAIASRADFEEGSYTVHLPRFSEDNLPANLALVDVLRAMAAERGVSPGELALAWILHQGDHIAPIPGTRRIGHLEENVRAAGHHLSTDDSRRIAAALAPVRGARYTAEQERLLGER